MTRRVLTVPVWVAAAGVALGQAPPPRLLPASVTGGGAPGGVRPAGAVTPAAPAARFLADLRAFPPETAAAVYSTRSAGDWLYRANQPGGRFLGADSELAQAEATLALAEAAAFTGDARFGARAAGAVLAQLAVVPQESAAGRGPAERVVVLSQLVRAVCVLPNADEGLTGHADRLCGVLRAELTAGTAPAASAAAVRAVLAVDAVRPNAGNRDAVGRAVGRLLTVKPGAESGPLVPALAEATIRANLDAGAVAATFAHADFLCSTQPAGAADAAAEAEALAHAIRLTRRVPDLARFARYRAAVVARLHAAQLAQVPETGPAAARGGVRGPDGSPRPADTAALARAGVAFLASGAEGGRAD